MQLVIKASPSSARLVEVRAHATVGEVREVVRDLTGIGEIDGKILAGFAGDARVEDCGLFDGCTVEVGCYMRGGMQLLVKTLTGKTISVEVEPEDSIARMKEKIADIVDMPPARQELIFCGHKLEDDKTLQDYNYMKDATFHLVFRFPGPVVADDSLAAHVSETTPASGAAGISPLSSFFSATLDSTLRVTPGGIPPIELIGPGAVSVPGAVEAQENGRKLIFSPATALDSNQAYVLSIQGDGLEAVGGVEGAGAGGGGGGGGEGGVEGVVRVEFETGNIATVKTQATHPHSPEVRAEVTIDESIRSIPDLRAAITTSLPPLPIDAELYTIQKTNTARPDAPPVDIKAYHDLASITAEDILLLKPTPEGEILLRDRDTA